jgi:hypothetical protein
LKTFYGGTSTNNDMSADIIVIGQELAGKHGAWSEFTLHTKNLWATQPMGTDWIFWYAPQTTKGNASIDDDPPLGGWWVAPDSGSNEGGDFATACCQKF